MDGQESKLKVLFLCTNNSARSQMAEGLLRALHGDEYEVFSAGTLPTAVHPLAVRAMGEVGITISGQKSKDVSRFIDKEMDFVVTVCDRAKEACPFFPYGKKFLHQSFTDPAAETGREEKRLEAFRRARDEIRAWIEVEFGPRKP